MWHVTSCPAVLLFLMLLNGSSKCLTIYKLITVLFFLVFQNSQRLLSQITSTILYKIFLLLVLGINVLHFTYSHGDSSCDFCYCLCFMMIYRALFFSQNYVFSESASACVKSQNVPRLWAEVHWTGKTEMNWFIQNS